MSQEKISGANKAHTESVLLTFWGHPCTSGKNKSKEKPLAWHFSEKGPTIRQLEVACVGAIVGKTTQSFDVHGILPQSLMPKLSIPEQQMFMAALERQLVKQMQIPLKENKDGYRPLKRDLVDWVGSNNIE